MLPVAGGWVYCPTCGAARIKRRLLRLHPTTEGHDVQLYCTGCKSTFVVDIHKGQCFQSQSR